jgi:hypothetical protein
MNEFVADVLSFARPIFLEAVGALPEVTPVIEATNAEVRLTMHGRMRNGRDVGIRIYQCETITRFITTLDPLESADTSKPLRPSLRYATTPEWPTMRAEATSFAFGEEHFEIVLSEFLAQMLDSPREAGVPIGLATLRASLPGAIELDGRIRINTATLCSATALVDLMPVGEWVRATVPVAEVTLSDAQRLRMNDYTTFFRTKQEGAQLLLEGEVPGALADVDGMRWFAGQLALTADSVARNLALVADVNGVGGS